MTRNQFIKLHENFADYARMETTYKAFNPHSGKKEKRNGMFRGIGVGALDDFVILARMGHTEAIRFEDVKLPKLAWE